MSSVWVSEADCIGMFGQEDGRKFIDNFGGTTFFIPQKVIAENSICKVMGMEHMATLCREYRGCRITVAGTGKATNKKEQILSLFAKGLTNTEIAREVKVSDRYVRLIVSPIRSSRRQ